MRRRSWLKNIEAPVTRTERRRSGRSDSGENQGFFPARFADKFLANFRDQRWFFTGVAEVQREEDDRQRNEKKNCRGAVFTFSRDDLEKTAREEWRKFRLSFFSGKLISWEVLEVLGKDSVCWQQFSFECLHGNQGI
ncbi:hypothetical protein U1Q18_002922 [Sarracenia purpurea var. burkii]